MYEKMQEQMENMGLIGEEKEDSDPENKVKEILNEEK